MVVPFNMGKGKCHYRKQAGPAIQPLDRLAQFPPLDPHFVSTTCRGPSLSLSDIVIVEVCVWPLAIHSNWGLLKDLSYSLCANF